VGSGKTLVAAAVALMTAKNGGQTAYMAPTEILALQHYESMKGFLEPFGIKVALLCGGMPLKERAETEEMIKKGEVQVICGTHALISGSAQYKNLLLAITDEQHRFGVSQRSELSEKGESAHILAMSATPIPRTLALTLYGDLEVSFMRDMPKGRQKIDTFVVGESYRERINRFMEKQVAQGRQVYVVCPMIEEGEEESGLISAEERSEKLKKRFPELKVGLLHGRLPSKEKGETIKSFRQGDIDILVSTTVIEVGVDSPNASLIVVENAERFGLSQLHQIRGRVGRGRHKSYCILMSAGDSGVARERLDAMSKTNDGFLIAEEDLRLRGPGDFFGKRQHGLPEMHIADLGADMEVLKRVADYSGELFSKDPDLKLPEHRDLKLKIKEVFQESLSLS
jgi:ATP-dependent DNA helicase RecG